MSSRPSPPRSSRQYVYFVSPGGRVAQGGMGRVAEYVARTWEDRQLPMKVIDTYGPGALWKMPFYWAAAVGQTLVGCLKGEVGVVHVNISQRLSLRRKGSVVAVAKAFGVPVVIHCHGSRFAEFCRSRSPSGYQRILRLLNSADAIMTLGSYWTDYMANELGIDRAKLVTAPNAVPGPEVIAPRAPTPPVKMVFLGRIGERKGVPTLLEALATPDMQRRDWSITIAGDGEVDDARQQAARLGLGSRVSFPGWTSEATVRQLLTESHIMVLPSRNEGLPMAVLEAMAHQTTVVTTGVGSIPDAITHGENGWIVAVDDVQDLSAALSTLIDDRSLRETLARNARQTFLDRFHITPYVRRLSDLYHRVRGD